MDTSVLIVGAGPVGLTLAHKLATYGCPIRIIDKNQAPTDLSKALVVWQRTLEVLDSTVDIQQFLEHSDASSVHGMIFQTPEETLGQVELDGSEGPLPTGVFIPQSATEHLLVEKLAQQGIHVERETELVSFTQDDHGVVSQIRGPQGDTTSVTSAWIVGADGAHSKVRHGLDLPFDGDTIERRWLLADITVEKEQDPHFMHAYLGADAMLGLFPVGAKRWRVILDGGPGARRGDPTEQEIQDILDERTGKNWQITGSTWLSEFVINERLVPQYRVGRAFLAGDAAHVHSPAGGQGMNTGMQDAVNLAWKLALAQGRDDCEQLLDSYHEERHVIGKKVVAETSQMIHMAMVHNPLLLKLRAFAMRHATRSEWFKSIMRPKISEIDLNYRGQSLARTAHKTKGALQPGDRLPNMQEGDGFIYEKLRHNGATLLTLDVDPADLPQKLGSGVGAMPVHAVALNPDGALAQELGLPSGGAALVRPDSYIGAIRHNMPEMHSWLQSM